MRYWTHFASFSSPYLAAWICHWQPTSSPANSTPFWRRCVHWDGPDRRPIPALRVCSTLSSPQPIPQTSSMLSKMTAGLSFFRRENLSFVKSEMIWLRKSGSWKLVTCACMSQQGIETYRVTGVMMYTTYSLNSRIIWWSCSTENWMDLSGATTRAPFTW
jgi:hypothetical protein